MHDHADIDERGGEQIGDRHGIECHGNTLANAVRAHETVAEFAARRENTAADLVGKIGSEQARVKGGKRLAFSFKNVPELELEHSDVRWPLPLA